MQKCHPINAIRYIIPLAAAVLIFSPDLHRDSGKKFINHPFLSTEPHWEESFPPDYNELYREKETAAVTGTNTIVAFGGKNSNEMIVE